MDTAILRSRILDLAIRGQLVPQDPNEGTADDLLKTIVAQRGKPITPITDNVPFDIPTNWRWVKLGDISNYGECISKDVRDLSKDAWILELEDLEKGSARIIQRITLQDRQIKGIRREFHKGAILYSKLRTYLNKVLIAPSDGYCTTEIVPFDTLCYNPFVCQILRSPYYLGYTAQLGYGVKMPRMSTTDVKRSLIPLPPLPEQHRIVAKVEELLNEVDKIEQAQADITKAATILRSRILDLAIRGQLVPQDPNEGTADDLLKAIAVQRGKPIIPITDNIPFSIPENWRWVKFNDYIDVRDGTHDTPKYVEKGIPFVTSKNLVKGSIDFSSCRFITNDDYENFNKRSNVEDQDILYAMIGTIGNPVIVKKDRDFAIKNVALFKKRISTTNMFYIYYLLMGMEKQFRSDATGGLQPFVSLKMFREALIPLPPLAEQRRIVSKLEELLAQIDKLN